MVALLRGAGSGDRVVSGLVSAEGRNAIGFSSKFRAADYASHHACNNDGVDPRWKHGIRRATGSPRMEGSGRNRREIPIQRSRVDRRRERPIHSSCFSTERASAGMTTPPSSNTASPPSSKARRNSASRVSSSPRNARPTNGGPPIGRSRRSASAEGTCC